MAIVLALVIVGWLVAFALGAQSGFDAQPEPTKMTTQTQPLEQNAIAYQETASAS